MNIWILTIGSSDIQLRTKANWTRLFRAVRSQLDDRGFNPSDAIEQRFQVPARVLGVVYSQPQAEQHFDDLVFPLIDNFLSKIKDQPIDKIILVLGDQSIFQPAERSSQNHAYWQDTCTLQPLLEKYLQQKLEESSPDLQFQTLLLRPTSTAEGLDDWNAVLKLVQDEFLSLEFPDNATIYVSHQAGTPAISSAIQFTSLSRFGQQVKFLVSNERDSKLTRVLDSSEYLKGIRQREALTLLDRHDYSGVEALVRDYLKENEDTKILLNAAIQWNFAKFDEFANEIQKLSSPEFQALVEEVKERSQQWWWTAYEAAYLAWLRLDQGNTVDAFFHSFRSIEGAFSDWGKKVFCEYVEIENDRAFLQPSILESSHDYFTDAKFKQDGTPKNSLAKLKQKLLAIAERIKNVGEKDQKPKGLLLFGDDLYTLFRSQKPDYEGANFNRFWNSEDGIGEKRNKNFHQLQGLSQENLLSDWEVNNPNEWEKQLLTYLNFIAKEDLSKKFESLEEASLMAKVHQELKNAIAHI